MVAGTKRDEMIVGGISVAAALWFWWRVMGASGLKMRFVLRDVVACWRVPWYVVSGVWEITVVMVKDLVGAKKAGSLYRVCGFETSKDEPLKVARRALATGYTTLAPNFIVIGIDYAQSRMLFHQLERSSVPLMTQELGAKR